MIFFIEVVMHSFALSLPVLMDSPPPFRMGVCDHMYMTGRGGGGRGGGADSAVLPRVLPTHTVVNAQPC